MRATRFGGALTAVALFVLAGCATEPEMVSGVWTITETVNAVACGEGTYQDTYTITVTQDGSDIAVSTPVGLFEGKIDGNQLQWEGSYPEDGGIVTIDLTLTVNGNSLSGSSTWTWSDGSFSCSGTTSVSGVRSSGGA